MFALNLTIEFESVRAQRHMIVIASRQNLFEPLGGRISKQD
jgi:hypothetical protein